MSILRTNRDAGAADTIHTAADTITARIGRIPVAWDGRNAVRQSRSVADLRQGAFGGTCSAVAAMAAAEPAAGKLAAFISGKQLKVMSAAVSAIARIGKSVFLDASNEGVSVCERLGHAGCLAFWAKVGSPPHKHDQCVITCADYASRSK